MTRMLVVLVVLVLVVGAAGELLVPSMLEARVERVVEEHTSGVADVEAEVGTFPFLPELALDGLVDHLRVTLRDVDTGPLTVGTVRFDLEGILLDRGSLVAGSVEVLDLSSGTATAEIEEAAITEALGVPVALEPGMLDLAGGALEIATDGAAPLEVPLPEQLLPCPPDVEATDDGIRLSCRFDEVPGVLAGVAWELGR